MKQLLFIGAGLLLMLASCGGNKEISLDNKSLYETKWLLKKIVSSNVTEDVNTKAFIKFVQNKQSAGGNGSCNSFGSTTSITNNNMRITNIFSTKMYCEDVQKIEDAFFRQLEKTTRFEIRGNMLILYNGNDRLLEFMAE